MESSGVSLKSSLRKTVLEAYRARGRGKSNLWLIYSVKTNSDWILPSDRQFIHWLYFLEANPEVRDFNLAPEPILSHDAKEPRTTELDAIVTLRNGQVEWHEVKAGKKKLDPQHESQMIAQINASIKDHVVYKRFNDLDLEPKVRVALRWFKAIGFAAAIRGENHISCHSALVMAMRDIQQGNIRQLLRQLDEYDTPVILGLLVRLAISGVVKLDLENTTFGMQTAWAYHE